jgi:dimethylglycine catabolism A
MWRFENPVRHQLPVTQWPTREEADRSLLYSPIQVGRVTLQNRTWVPAMVPWRATEDGYVTHNILEWYGRFAEGRPGAIVVEATGIRDIPSGPLLRIGHDRFIPGLRDLVDAVRHRSNGETRVFIQIIDFLSVRRRPDREKYFRRYLKITSKHKHRLSELMLDDKWHRAEDTEVASRLNELKDSQLEQILDERELEALQYGYRERVTDTHLPHIANLPEVLPDIFADAALRAREAGFDGVELHYAHAYTMASFLSARNNRTDGYGGARENRVRLPLEVFEKVRSRVGDDYTVGTRFLGDEVIEGGSHLHDAIFFGVEFAKAGFDYLSVSKGGKFDDAEQPKVGHAVYPYTGRSGYECMPTVLSDEAGPFCRNVPLAAEIRSAIHESGLSTPIITSGGIATFKDAESILQSGEADIVAAARQSLADPDWFLKARLGKGDDIRRCVFTNYCEGLDQMHRQVTCKLWDRIGLDELGLDKSDDGKGRRLIPPPWVERTSSDSD